MRNTIVIDLNNQCTCNCILNTASADNSINLELLRASHNSPTIHLKLSDGTEAVGTGHSIDGNILKYTIPEAYWDVSGTLTIWVTDGTFTSENISFECSEINSNREIRVKENSGVYIVSVFESTPGKVTPDDLAAVKAKLCYKSGETEDFEWYGGATLTTSKQHVVFTLPVKDMSDISSVSISGASIVVRQSDSYLVGSGSAMASSGFTVSIAKINSRLIRLIFVFSSSLSGTNNDAVAIHVKGTLKFT